MKMTKKVLSILLSLMLVLGTVAVGGMSASAELSGDAWLDIGSDTAISNGDIKKSEGAGWSITETENGITLNLDNLDLTYDGSCIYANNLDLTITGSAKLTSNYQNAILLSSGSLTLDGRFTFGASYQSTVSVDSNLTVEGGSLSVINTGDFIAVSVGDAMTVNGGSVYAKTESSSRKAISGIIILNNGEAFALGDEFAKEVLISALGGKGTASEPYEITSYAGLKEFSSIVNGTNVAIAQNTAGCAKLMKDIDASASAEANDWTPIGNNSNKYTGTFDGIGHKITGLTFNDTSATYVGLFGYVGMGGKVRNVGLEGGKISGFQDVGSVAGCNYMGSIINCYNTSDVYGYSYYVGGVVGYNNGPVTNCYNTGDVSGNDNFTGGIAGKNADTHKITNCYNTGDVSGSNDVGGVVGWNMDKGKVLNCYNTGDVSGTGVYVGGVVGENRNSTVTDCYYDMDAAVIPESDESNTWNAVGANNSGTVTNVTGLTTAQMTGANALRNMVFEYGDGEVSPWLTKADGAEDGGEYRLFYPHLKGFAYDRTSATEDWPAKVEITVGLSDGNSCTYDGEEHGVYVTVGDSSAPEGATVTYSQYKYFDEDNRWEWEETSDSPTDPGNYRMTARDGDKVIVTKYFTILEQATDYTVSYYKKTGEDWSTDTVTPVDAGNYKAVVTFTDTGHDQIEKEFTITPKSILSESVSVTLSQDTAEYTGGGIMPEVTEVKVGEKVLNKNTDYIVSYGDNINASENAKVIVTGKGNYKDSVEKTFVITPASVKLTANSRNTDVYDGTEKTISGFTSSVEGLTFEGVTASGSGTQAGSYDVTFTGVTIGETKDSSGNYVVTATENGTLTINPAAPGTSAAAEDIDYGQTAVVTFTVPADAKGKVTFTLDEAESGVTKDIENGQAVCEFENLTIGSHKVECVYTGDGNYEPGEAKTASFEVKSIDCPLTVNYVYADGSKAAETFTDNVAIFTQYSVTSPGITGYAPDTATVEGIMGDDDMGGKTVTVKYSPVEYTATFVDENGEMVAEVPYTVETEKLEAPAVPEKQGYNGEWKEYELTPGGITVKPVYTPADICPLDNEYHGDNFWGRLVKFFHTVIWKAFNLVGINIYLKIW